MQKSDAMGTKAFNSQASAQAAFNNKFTSQPAVRPAYIPSTVMRGGVSYTVVFHDGCYGYYNPLGLWIALAATDAIVANASQPYNQPIPVTYHHHGTLFYVGVCAGTAVVVGGIILLVVLIA
jgi:hypothetical protein